MKSQFPIWFSFDFLGTPRLRNRHDPTTPAAGTAGACPGRCRNGTVVFCRGDAGDVSWLGKPW